MPRNAFPLAGALLLLACSCSAPQKLFQSESAPASGAGLLSQYFAPTEPILGPGDKITITVWGHEDLSIGSVNSSFNSNEETGKWVVVDNSGEVNLPKLGRVRLEGYNLKEVNYLLEQRYRTFLRDPLVSVKVLNHYVTVLGEVKNPGKYQIDNERVTLVELIGQAGGLTDYAGANRVKVIRMAKGKAVELFVDLSRLESIPDYNVVIQPRDIVYIEPTSAKKTDDTLRKATPIAGLLSALAVLAAIFL